MTERELSEIVSFELERVARRADLLLTSVSPDKVRVAFNDGDAFEESQHIERHRVVDAFRDYLSRRYAENAP
jgi:hypothetical protein